LCGMKPIPVRLFRWICAMACARHLLRPVQRPSVPQPHHHHDDAPAPGEKLGTGILFRPHVRGRSQAAMERGVALLHSFWLHHCANTV